MQHFAESRFWRACAVAFIAALFYLGWSIAGDRSVLPVAQAGGVSTSPSGAFLFTTNERGDTLFAWPATQGGTAAASWVEMWTWDSGTVARKPLRFVDTPGLLPPGGGPLPPAPGGRFEGGGR